MSLLIINTLEEDDPAVKNAIRHLSAKTSVHTFFHTAKMKIAPCIGCNACWLRTPGVCAVKDDYEQILKAYTKDIEENKERETAKRMIKKGKMTLDEIADCVPSLSLDELKKMEAELLQLA